MEQIARVYDIEREIKDFNPDERRRIRQERSKPLLEALHQWMILNRQKITDGTATAKALDYSLRRWGALTRLSASTKGCNCTPQLPTQAPSVERGRATPARPKMASCRYRGR